MKLRLIMRKSIADCEGHFVDYEYLTKIIDIEIENQAADCRPEVVGGEWLYEVAENDNHLDYNDMEIVNK